LSFPIDIRGPLEGNSYEGGNQLVIRKRERFCIVKVSLGEREKRKHFAKGTKDGDITYFYGKKKEESVKST